MSDAQNPNTPTNPATIIMGASAQAFAAVTDNGNPTSAGIVWSESSNGAVIAINASNGNIGPVAPGQSIVTATATVNGVTATGTCLVTVTAAGDNLVVTVTVQ